MTYEKPAMDLLVMEPGNEDIVCTSSLKGESSGDGSGEWT